MRRLLLLGAAAGLAGLGVVLPATAASAHPLGNASVNTYAGIVVSPTQVHLDEVLDLAELPTVQARQRIDTDDDGQVSTAEADAYRNEQCQSLAGGLQLAVDQRATPLTVGASTLDFPAGQAGLPTLRLECRLAGVVKVTNEVDVTLSDTNLSDRLGWREVTINGDGVTVADADAPTESISARLTAYPEGTGLHRQLSASASLRPGGPRYLAPTAGASSPSEPQARGNDGLTQTLSSIVGGRQLSLAAGALAVLIALVLGGLHSLAPGHGKSLMAAAVVSRHGTGRQVLAIGATVAATHTTGVLVLGAVLWLTQAVAPEQFLPWLTVASGALLALAGATLLVRRLTGRRALSHGQHHHHHHDDHDHQHDHDHHGHDHHHQGHDHHHHAHAPAAPSRRWLVTMGMAGGLVPTPSALVVLLGATALGRAWFGVVLVAAYGIGMALTLLGAGLLLVRFQSWLERHFLERPWWTTLLRLAPVVTAALLVGSGVLIAARGLTIT